MQTQISGQGGIWLKILLEFRPRKEGTNGTLTEKMTVGSSACHTAQYKNPYKMIKPARLVQKGFKTSILYKGEPFCTSAVHGS